MLNLDMGMFQAPPKEDDDKEVSMVAKGHERCLLLFKMFLPKVLDNRKLNSIEI